MRNLPKDHCGCDVCKMTVEMLTEYDNGDLDPKVIGNLDEISKKYYNNQTFKNLSDKNQYNVVLRGLIVTLSEMGTLDITQHKPNETGH